MRGCVVGYGAIGPVHAAALSEINSLYAVCDIDSSRLLGIDENIIKYSDFRDVLSDSNIDVVHICTPHFLHVDMAIEALKAGKNVVLEKPVGISRSEVNRLFDYKTDKKICIMFQNRTNLGIVKLKEITDTLAYGKMLSMSANLFWHRDREYYAHDEWRGKKKTEGGGLLINQAIHTLDLICYLGGKVTQVESSISTKKLGDFIEVEDTADAILTLENGVNAIFYATNCASTNRPCEITVEFEKATLKYADNRLYKITDNECEILIHDNSNITGKSYWGTGHFGVIRNFYDYLCGKSDSYLQLTDAKDTMELLFKIYEGNN